MSEKDHSKMPEWTIIAILLVLVVIAYSTQVLSGITFISKLITSNSSGIFGFFQTMSGLLSFVVAFYAYRISDAYGKSTEIQNRLAFEEFKPILEPIKKDGWLELGNGGDFEAAQIVIYSRGVEIVDGEITYGKTNKDESAKLNFLLSPGAKLKVDVPDTGKYFSFIILYSNYSSGTAYFRGFNFKAGGAFKNIGETEPALNERTYPSPILQQDFTTLINKARIKKQIEDGVNYEALEQLLDSLLLESIKKPAE